MSTLQFKCIFDDVECLSVALSEYHHQDYYNTMLNKQVAKDGVHTIASVEFNLSTMTKEELQSLLENIIVNQPVIGANYKYVDFLRIIK